MTKRDVLLLVIALAGPWPIARSKLAKVGVLEDMNTRGERALVDQRLIVRIKGRPHGYIFYGLTPKGYNRVRSEFRLKLSYKALISRGGSVRRLYTKMQA